MIAALTRLGIKYSELLTMRSNLLVEFKRKTNDLLHTWSKR